MNMNMSEKMRDVVHFSVMVLIEGSTSALFILAKTAMTGGMSPYVFVVYTNALGTLILLPYSFLFHTKRTEHSLFTLPLLVRFFFLGLTGITLSQNLVFVGLNYSSPIVVCAMGLLIPIFDFLLNIIFRKTKIDFSSRTFRVKSIGMFITISGAAIVAFYKGPFVRNDLSITLTLHPKQLLLIFYTAPDHWVLGSLLVVVSFLSVSICNFIQMGTVKYNPHVMKVAAFYSMVGTIQSTICSLIVEKDLNAWKLELNFDLILIIITAVFSSVIRSSVQILFTNMRGPFYVPFFQPFRIFWTIFFGCSFFANSMHYGSIVGTIICGMGYYTVMWGKAKENEKLKNCDIKKAKNNIPKEKVPLLQDHDSPEVP